MRRTSIDKGAKANELVCLDQSALPSPACVPDTDFMTTVEPAKIFHDLAGEITQHYHRGRVIVAVDGVDGQTTGQFADSLADAMRSGSRAVVRSNSAPDAATERHDPSFPRYDIYQDSDDHSRLRNIVSQFRDGNSFSGDSEAVISADAVLIIDGRFLLRPELRGLWHFGVWLEGDTHLSDNSLEAQIRYTRDKAPRSAAHAIFDVTNAEAPARVWADSC